MSDLREGMSVRVPGNHTGVITKVDKSLAAPYYVQFNFRGLEGALKPLTLLYRAEQMTVVSANV